MLRLLAVTALGLGMMMSGCTTTQQVIAKVQSSSDTPLDQVLKMRPDLRNELATVEIRQFFNNVESPTVGQVKVTYISVHVVQIPETSRKQPAHNSV